MTAAVGVAAGLGHPGVALLSVILTWFILAVLGRVQKYLDQPQLKNTTRISD